MKSAFRNAFFTVRSSSCSINTNKPHFPLSLPSTHTRSFLVRRPFSVTRRSSSSSSSSSSSPTPLASGDTHAPPTSPTSALLEKQFDDFRHRLEESGSLRDRIKVVSAEIESCTRILHSSLLLVHQSRPIPEVLQKAKAQIDVLKELFSRLAEITRECTGQYYRYHGEWKSQTQAVVSLLAFMHWLETGSLLIHTEAEEKLGLNTTEFGLDIEDYLVGICFMSNELPRYVVNRVTAGDYDCPRKVLKFLTDLHSSFRLLNLRNDFLRKKFDGMKYDLKRVEEVHYDVKIRGLVADGDSRGHESTE